MTRQPSLTYMILETILPQYYSSPGGPPFCCVNITRDIKNFVQISILLKKNKNCRNLNENLHISDNVVSTKKGGPHFGMPGLKMKNE